MGTARGRAVCCGGAGANGETDWRGGTAIGVVCQERIVKVTRKPTLANTAGAIRGPIVRDGSFRLEDFLAAPRIVWSVRRVYDSPLSARGAVTGL